MPLASLTVGFDQSVSVHAWAKTTETYVLRQWQSGSTDVILYFRKTWLLALSIGMAGRDPNSRQPDFASNR
jgi:hypothetical protein